MKVEYIQCDICGEKMSGKSFSRYTVDYYGDTGGTVKGNVVYGNNHVDICADCFEKMKEYILKNKGEKKNDADTGRTVDKGSGT